MNRIFLFSLTFLLYLSCQKEEIREKEFPRLTTSNVTNITPDGAKFTALLSGDYLIVTEYGFVWGLSDNLTVQNSEKFVISTALSSNSFALDITFSFRVKQNYYVRSYVKCGEFYVYGNPVQFQSLGSKAPSITGFQPQSATWGDTITINCENIGFQRNNILVYFGKFGINPFYADGSIIRVVVPEALNSETCFLYVEYQGNRSNPSTSFSLLSSFGISSIDKEIITWGDIVQLTGVFPVQENITITSSGQNIPILELHSDRLKIKIPESLKYQDSVMFNVSAYNHSITSPKVAMQKPYISAASPENFGWGDTILFYGFFNPVQNENKIFFSDIEAKIIEFRGNSLKCVVPNTSSYISKITFISCSLPLEYREIELAGPEIISVSPRMAYPNEYVTIKGKHFLSGHTSVYINNRNIYVSGVSSNEIVFGVPDIDDGVDDLLKIKVLDKETQTNDLNISHLSVTSITPTSVTFGEILTVNGSGFCPDLNVFLSSTKAEVLDMTEYQMHIRVPYNSYGPSINLGLTIRNIGLPVWNVEIYLKKATITEISPLNGKYGDILIISGTNFNPMPAYSSVYFNSEQTYTGEIISASPTTITVKVPEMIPGEYSISMSNGAGYSFFGEKFLFVNN